MNGNHLFFLFFKAFNRSFAELLTQVIYSQPTLRPPILNSLKILIEKTLTLTKRSLPSDGNSINTPEEINGSKTLIKNEFGFNAQSHLNHLKSFAANFLSVLFNVYNSSYDANKSSTNDQKTTNANRGYMVDCIRSVLELVSDKVCQIPNFYNSFTTFACESILIAKLFCFVSRN